MTLATQTAKVTANGNDSATVFSYSPIVIFASSDLVVTLVDAAGTESTLSEGTGASAYSVSPTTFGAGGATGSVTYPADAVTPIATGVSLVIKRVLTIEQDVDLENQGGYDPDVLEAALDKQAMIVLQQQEILNRAFRLPVSETGVTTTEMPAADASKYFRWNSAADAIEFVAIGGLTPSDHNVVTDGSASAPAFAFSADGDTGMYREGTNSLGFAAGGDEVLLLATVGAAAITHIQMRASATGVAPRLIAIGETNTGLDISSNGTGTIGFWTGGVSEEQVRITRTASPLNFVYMTGAATGGDPIVGTVGQTNSDLKLAPAGSGGVYVGAATGGGQGNDTINAAGIYQNGEPYVPQSYLAGMILSNDTDTDHDINITAGICRTADNTASMELTSEQTKKIDVNWATGNDAGGIQSGESGVSNTTWYHVHVFTVGATVEVGFDTSITAAGLIANHGGAAGKYRRIGAVLTDGSANILGFTQVGDEFLWDDPPLDINVSSVTSATLYAMSTPLGVRCKVNFNFYLSSLGNSEGAYFTCPDQDDETPAIASPGPVPQSASTNNNGSIIAVGGLASTMTNTSSQVRVDSQDTSFTLTATTLNYIDRRGRDD